MRASNRLRELTGVARRQSDSRQSLSGYLPIVSGSVYPALT
jgi:hypothetical protein